MAPVLDWRTAANQRDIIDAAVGAVEQGQLVVFPSDSTYQIAANLLDVAAVVRLGKIEGGSALTVALSSPDQALDWVPDMSPLARRLARRCWPGPVVLVFPESLAEEALGQLPEPVRRSLCREQQLALQVPDHDVLLEILFALAVPLVLREAGPTPAITAEQVQQAVGVQVDLVVDDGPGRAGEPCTHVRIDGESWTVLQEGAVSAEEVARKTNCVILFVCTGNTCRSPMAAALCRKLLAERLQCSVDELPKRGYEVLSAGLAALPGDPASADAVEAVQELGADLGGHASRALNAELVLEADHLLTMTLSHQIAVSARYASYGAEPRLLDPTGNDISDPVGLDREVYRDCARQIHEHLVRFIDELPIPKSNTG